VKRLVWITLGLAIVGLLVVGVALRLEGPRLAEHLIRRGAHYQGYRDVRVEVRSLGLRHVELAEFSAGPAPGLTTRDVKLAWTLRHLLAARIASVEVGSATLHGLWTEAGVEFPVIPPAEEGPWIEPPVFDRLALTRAQIELGGSEGPVSIGLRDLDFGTPAGERMRAKGQASVERKAGRLTAAVDLVLDGQRVSGNATLRDQAGKLEVTADLGKSGPPPGQFPMIDGPEDLTLVGRLSLRAEAADLSPLTPSFTADGVVDFRLAEGRLSLKGDSLDVAGFGMILGGLDLAIELTELSPPAAPPGQTVSVETLQFGMDVGGGALRFGARGGVLDIEALDWRFHGGALSAKGEFDPASEENELVVHVGDVDLAALVADLGRTDLAMTGRLSGELPLRFEGNRIFAAGGRLSAGEGGGVIRYQTGGLPPPGLEAPAKELPAKGSVGGVDLVLDALRNFQYRKLEVGVDGELTGEMILHLTLEGSNPDVYDGYPFQLNLNLEGPLADVVQGSTTGFRVQDAVEERFQKRGERR
jgi:hypothetical protein